jgi:hypothetical protein
MTAKLIGYACKVVSQPSFRAVACFADAEFDYSVHVREAPVRVTHGEDRFQVDVFGNDECLCSLSWAAGKVDGVHWAYYEGLEPAHDSILAAVAPHIADAVALIKSKAPR